jgi:hypothetical protein
MRQAVRPKAHALQLQFTNATGVEESFLPLLGVPRVGAANLSGDEEHRGRHPALLEGGPGVAIETRVAVVERDDHGANDKARPARPISEPLVEVDCLVAPLEQRVELLGEQRG